MADPPIDYTSKDYASFRQMLLDVKRQKMPEWTSESPGDFGVVLLEMFSYVGDILSYYGDRIANEAYLTTATQRRNILAMARMLDYRPSSTVAATTTLRFTTTGATTIPKGTRVQTVSLDAARTGEVPVVFTTDVELVAGSAGAHDVGATEGEVVADEVVATSTGGIDQRYTLFRYPVVEGSVQVFVDEGGGEVEWVHYDHIIDATSTQNVYTTIADEDGSVTVLFGDDVNGRIPPSGATVTAHYRVGGGTRGNVGPNSLVEILDTLASVASVTNPTAATGGADAESNDQIRVNAPRSLTALERAVTLNDYAALALRVGGVAKAMAEHPGGNNITVRVAPFGGGVASASVKTAVGNYLADRKMVNHTVTVDDPTYVNVDITVTVVVKEHYSRSATARGVEKALKEQLAFDAVDFGHRIALSRVYDTIMSVPGVSYATLTKLDRAAGSGVADVVMTASEIPQAGTVTVNSSGGIAGT